MSAPESRELLQQIVTNTTPSKTTMISISTTNPEFSVNFPTAIPVKEIALAQLRVYYSWPNIRSKPFGGLPANNSLVFANKNKSDGTPDWQVVSIPTGSYQLEQINEEFQRRIKSITGKESKIAITVYEPTLSSVIEINSLDYVVDIYQSSIRSVLGWPEVAPAYQGPPEPQRSDFIIDVKKFIQLPEYRNKHPFIESTTLRYRDYYTHYNYFIIIHSSREGLKRVSTLNTEEINSFSSPIKSEHERVLNDLKNLLSSINTFYNDDLKNQIIETIQHLNQVAADLEYANKAIVDRENIINIPEDRFSDSYIVNEDDQIQRVSHKRLFKTVFLKYYGITEEQLSTFIIPGFDSSELKKSVSNLIDEHFKRICDSWKKLIPPPTILKYSNDPFGSGRHISPNIVNITSTIALNLTCDVIDSSYNVNLVKSNQAQQGYILYSSSIQSPPGWLIVSEPINQVYLRVHNPLLSRMNFKLTNQDGNIIDLRNETLYINLYIRS